MFKRVKTIGLLGVGLLTMLGTKAEAHYMYVNGKWVWHSVGCPVTIGDIPSSPDPGIVICDVNTVQVEAECPDGSITQPLSIQVSLTAQEQLDPGQSYVEVIVDDEPLRFHSTIISACGSYASDVLIRNMTSTVTIQCVGSIGDPTCSAPLLTTSTAVATCELPAQCTLNNCPAIYRTYTCDRIVTHVN